MTDPRTVKLDRLYEEDWRSLDYPVSAELERDVPEYRPRSYTWSISDWFDQGQEGACVAFAFVHELVARPQTVVGLSHTHAFGWYHHFQHEDPWEGCNLGSKCPIDPGPERYEGTSVLAGAKVVTDKGFYFSYHWALTLEELVLGLGYFGPCVLGVNWYEGMFRPDAKGFLHPLGRLAGGHAILAHSVKLHFKRGTWAGWWKRTWADVDLQRSYVILHNSWGKSWGEMGRAKLRLSDLDRLLNERGDACFPRRTTKTAIG